MRGLKVSIDITHSYIGDLRIELIAPKGRTTALHGQLGGEQQNLVMAYDSATPLSALAGSAILGNWTLRVADLAAIDTGTLNRWNLKIVPA